MTKRKDPKEFLPDGRPTKYRKEVAELAYKLALLGATDKEMANFFGVAESTIHLWKVAHPEFSESITRGKIFADTKVAESLFKRALGYSHPEEKIFHHKGKIIRVTTTKHYPPDTQAASLWLRNRQPKLWRDQKFLNDVEEPEERPETTKELMAGIVELQKELARLEAQL